MLFFKCELDAMLRLNLGFSQASNCNDNWGSVAGFGFAHFGGSATYRGRAGRGCPSAVLRLNNNIFCQDLYDFKEKISAKYRN